MTGSSSPANKHVLWSQQFQGAAGCGGEPALSVVSPWTGDSSVLGQRLSRTVIAVTGSAAPRGCSPPSCPADQEAAGAIAPCTGAHPTSEHPALTTVAAGSDGAGCEV